MLFLESSTACLKKTFFYGTRLVAASAVSNILWEHTIPLAYRLLKDGFVSILVDLMKYL